MKVLQYIALLAVGIAILLAILYFVPQTNQLVLGVRDGFLTLLDWVVTGIKGLLVACLIFGFGIFAGYVFKGYSVAYVDSKLEKSDPIGSKMHWGIAIVFGFVFGIVQAVFMPTVIGWETWVRWFAAGMGLDVVLESLPIVWLIYAFVTFIIAYLSTSYKVRQYRENY
jgi:hypothetical protein